MTGKERSIAETDDKPNGLGRARERRRKEENLKKEGD